MDYVIATVERAGVFGKVHRLHRIVEVNVRTSRSQTPSRRTVNISSKPSLRLAAASG
jgi:hypothetical protein